MHKTDDYMKYNGKGTNKVANINAIMTKKFYTILCHFLHMCML